LDLMKVVWIELAAGGSDVRRLQYLRGE
jgi:hypothetical protein